MDVIVFSQDEAVGRGVRDTLALGVVFYCLKTEFDLKHPLSHDLKGLSVYYLLIAVVWALLLLFKAYVQGDRSERLCISRKCVMLF